MRNTKVGEWIIRYGWDQVKKEVLLQGPNSSLNDDECRQIRDKGTLWPSGLNMTSGGDCGDSWGLDPERDARLRAKWAATAKSDNFAKARNRLQRLSKLPAIEFHAEMARLRRRAEKLGMPQDKLERLYPNTFTLVQIRRLQGKDWGVPGPKGDYRQTEEEKQEKKRARKRAWDARQCKRRRSPASSGQSRGKRKQANGSSGSNVTGSPKFRPSAIFRHSPRSAQGRYVGQDGELHDAGSTCPSECDE